MYDGKSKSRGSKRDRALDMVWLFVKVVYRREVLRSRVAKSDDLTTACLGVWVLKVEGKLKVVKRRL